MPASSSCARNCREVQAKRCVCTFNFPQCSTLNSTPRIARSRKRHRVQCTENLSLSLSCPVHAYIVYFVCATTYRFDFFRSAIFLNYSVVQTECLTKPVNSFPRVMLSAWYGLASAVLHMSRNYQDGQCSKSVYAYQSNPNVLHRSVAISGELGKISDPIRFRARGFLSGNCSGKLLFEFPFNVKVFIN